MNDNINRTKSAFIRCYVKWHGFKRISKSMLIKPLKGNKLALIDLKDFPNIKIKVKIVFRSIALFRVTYDRYIKSLNYDNIITKFIHEYESIPNSTFE